MDRSENGYSELCLEHLAIQTRAQLADPRTASHAFDPGERVYSLSCVHFPVARGIVLQLQGVGKPRESSMLFCSNSSLVSFFRASVIFAHIEVASGPSQIFTSIQASK